METNMTTDLVPGEDFRDCLFSRSHIEKKKGNGPDIKLILTFRNQRHAAKKWTVTDSERASIAASQFLIVCGKVDKGGSYDGEITINSVRSAAEQEIPEDISSYLSPCHESHTVHLTRFEQLVASVQEPNLLGLLLKIFDKEKEIWPQFCEAHAAGKKHHAYSGGLLHHSVEVAELCASAAAIVPTLSHDLLVACALVHDLGKLTEMEHGLNAGEYTAAGVLSGHISLGASRVRRFMDSIKGFPSQLKETVTHMILSHHGVLEYGSPKLPMFPEAQVLSQCDLLSARVFEYTEAAKNANGQLCVWLSGKESVQIYTGDLGLQKPAEVVRETTTTYVTQPREVPTFHTTKLRIRGLVAAGAPEQGNDEAGETREVVLPGCGADFLVRVTGDSMADEGIREHDVLFVKEIESPRNGDIVIAHVGATGEVVKRYRSDSAPGLDMGAQWLESENSSRNYPNIPVDSETRIRGKVVGLLRDF